MDDSTGLKILIVDSDRIVAMSVSMLIPAHISSSRTVVATNGVAAHNLIRSKNFDLAILAFNTYDIHGLHLLRQLGTCNLKAIALTHLKGKALIMELMRSGIHGYINKDDEMQELINCIDKVSNGVKYFNSLSREIAFINNKFMADNPKLVLTVREVEILVLMAAGFTSAEIGLKLNTSKKGIDSSREEMMLKTKTSNAVELMMYCIENGVVSRKKMDESRKQLETLDLTPASSEWNFESAAREVINRNARIAELHID